jgi:hypothetical protein
MKRNKLSISAFFALIFWITPLYANGIDLESTGTDLSVSIFDLIDPVEFGNPINYQITVTNNGPQSANDVLLELGTTANGSIIQNIFTTGPSGLCSPVSSILDLSCQIALLNVGEVSVLDLLFLPTEPGEILFFAAVSSPLTDVDEENNTDSEITLYRNPVSAVPVPAAAWLFGTALIGLVGFSNRRQAA